MKTRTLYTCEICHTDYANKEKAKDCEKGHKLLANSNEIVCDYKPIGQIPDGAPVKIRVKFGDRWIEYKR